MQNPIEVNSAQLTAAYIDRQGGVDRHVVVVQFINKRVSEILEKNHFQNSTSLVESTTNRLMPLVSKFSDPEDLTSLFNYVLSDAVNKFQQGQIKKPMNYALSVLTNTVNEGTTSFAEFIEKQENVRPESEALPTYQRILI